jgi:hypothetical protein
LRRTASPARVNNPRHVASQFSLFQGVVYDGMNDSSKLIPIFASLARWLIFTEAFLDTACGR